jgi:hypothetical protein
MPDPPRRVDFGETLGGSPRRIATTARAASIDRLARSISSSANALAGSAPMSTINPTRMPMDGKLRLMESLFGLYEQQRAGIGEYFLNSLFADIDAPTMFAGIQGPR